jgi:hypothetical protein
MGHFHGSSSIYAGLLCKVSRLRPNLFRKRHPDLPELWVIERALPGDIYSYVAKFFNY